MKTTGKFKAFLIATLVMVIACDEGFVNTGALTEDDFFPDGLVVAVKTDIQFLDMILLNLETFFENGQIDNVFENEAQASMPKTSDAEINSANTAAFTRQAYVTCREANIDNTVFFGTTGNTLTEANIRLIGDTLANVHGYDTLPEELHEVLWRKAKEVNDIGRDEGRSTSAAANDAYNAACTIMLTFGNSLAG